MQYLSLTFGKMAPQGAPRGLLSYWILKRIAKGPTHGYEILTEIEQRTQGGWRPGAGAVYPLLKDLAQHGLIQSERVKGKRADQRRYRISKEGEKRLREAKKIYRTMGDRWNSLRGIITDIIEPESMADFLVEGTRKHFELVAEVLEANRDGIPAGEMRYMLSEYSLLLERQLEWASEAGRRATTSPRQKRRRN